MDLQTRYGRLEDLQKYTDLLQHVYEFSYSDERIGLPKKLFSKKIFASRNTQDYLASHLIDTNKQKTWLSFLGNELVGSVTCVLINNEEAELTGFYVHPDYQGRGFGKRLYNLALEFAGNRDLVLDIYTHNIKTIEMYKKWGWKLDQTKGNKGYFYRHWPEWPEGVQAKSLYMRLPRSRP